MQRKSGGPILSMDKNRMVALQESFWTDKNAFSYTEENDSWLYCDGEAYFQAFIEACEKASSRIFIMGWDLHTLTSLQPRREPPGQGKRWTLVAFLRRLLQQRPELHVYLLTWSPAPLYFLEREKLQNFKFTRMLHPRLHFRADSQHPVGGSHHEKIVVIDDKLAFVGGIDLTIRRWDSCQHRAQDPLRKDPDGHYYQPYHDTQLGFAGPAATQLAVLFQKRWKQVTGKDIPMLSSRHQRLAFQLPAREAIAFFPAAPLVLSMTYPSYRNTQQIRQIAQLYEDLLLAARRYVLIETQYLTSHHVIELLCRLSCRSQGPEIVIVLPERIGPWLEKKSMTHLQALGLSRVLQHDSHRRIRIVYPFDRELLPIHKYVTVHSKLMIIDDQFLTLGSANLNNRSMGLDSECNVTIDARQKPELQASMRQALAYIVAHYANHKSEYARRKLEKSGSIVQLIHSLRMLSPHKHLADFRVRLVPEEAIRWLDPDLLDMDQPSSLELAMDRWGGLLERMQRHFRIPPRMITLLLTGLAGASIAAAHVWLELPLDGSLDLSLQHWTVGAQLSGLGLIPMLYLAACLILAPLNLLILLTASFLPAMLAFPTIIVGVMGLVSLGYATGRLLGRLLFPEFQKSQTPLDFAALCLLRAMPIAPHSLVNAAAGAAGVPFVRFMAATLTGVAPGCMMLVIFQRCVINAFMNPSWKTFVPLLLLVLIAGGVYRWSRQRFSNYGS